MNMLLVAAKKGFEAKRFEALANLEILFNNSVGIGEHSDIQEEITKWVDQLAGSEDAVAALDANFTIEGKVKN